MQRLTWPVFRCLGHTTEIPGSSWQYRVMPLYQPILFRGRRYPVVLSQRQIGGPMSNTRRNSIQEFDPVLDRALARIPL